jgi:uncharacterized protein
LRALFDVNALIALLHLEHSFHQAAHKWWAEYANNGWASCPITENGVIRIMSNPRYSKLVNFSIGDVTSLIRGFIDNSDHLFWPDEISVIDERIFDYEKVLGPGQLTDMYLLGLAAKRGGVLVSFDQSISTAAIIPASSRHLVVI